MKTRALLAITFAAVLPAAHAELTNPGGTWTAVGAGAALVQSHGSAGCARGPASPFPGVCNDTGVVGGMRRPTEMKISVDAVNGTFKGSIALPMTTVFAGQAGCGKLNIEEGRITGRGLAFTTYRTVNGSRIPANWLGEVSDRGELTIRTFDVLPCDINNSPFSNLTGRLILPGSSSDTLVFRRGDTPSKKETNSPPAVGKWWTTDNGQVAALDLKVGRNGKVSGSVNLCGVTEIKIEQGTVAGRRVTFTTHKKINKVNIPQVWTGDLINDTTLRISSPVPTPCRYASSTTLVFARSR